MAENSSEAQSGESLVTGEMVDRALVAFQANRYSRTDEPYAEATEARRERDGYRNGMRAALVAVEGDIIEAFGASGHA